MRITVFGSGYVGLVTGACLADAGHHVLCVDTNEEKIADLRLGIVTIHESGLDVLVKRNLQADRLNFTTNAARGVEFGKLLFIAVGTPADEGGSADLQYVFAVAADIGCYMNDYKLVVNKSTVPVGTADKVRTMIAGELQRRNDSTPFDVCSNPEFLKEGAAIEDFIKGPRIIVGTDSDKVRELMQICYAAYNRNHEKLIFMDVRSAELTKYAANAMLATRISFMNEMANIAERTGADIEKVRVGIGSDPRIGYSFIYPGVGYGGACFPKDISALACTARSHGYEPRMLETVEAINRIQKKRLLEYIHAHFQGNLHGRTIAVWGLAFKPNTNDMREAPSRVLMEDLWTAGARVRAHDPKALDEARSLYGDREDLVYCEDQYDALDGADALAVVTEWKVYWNLNNAIVRGRMKRALIFDGRNIYDPAVMEKEGFIYYSIGRAPVLPAARDILGAVG